MKQLLILTIAAAALMAGASCSKEDSDERNNNPRKDIVFPTTKQSSYVEPGNAFAFRFLSEVDAAEKGDYLISPLSMQFLLGMILNGAEDETAAEICSVLGFGAGETAEVNGYCKTLLEQLPGLDKKTQVSIANAIIVNSIYPLQETYRDAVRSSYEAEVENADFADAASTLRKINGWCSGKTGGMIPKILDEINPDMLAYLMNAMYFKGQWSEKFDKSRSEAEMFTLEETGTRKQVTMMKQTEDFLYNESECFNSVRLPYGNKAFCMYVLLPNSGYTAADIARTLDADSWIRHRQEMETREVDLWLPKFETRYHIKLNDILTGMGMTTSFVKGKAHFKAMSPRADYLDFVQQDAVIQVDEEGAKAAAVSSAGMMGETSPGPSMHVVFHADHPFLYLIAEESTGAILFAGRYGGE